MTVALPNTQQPECLIHGQGLTLDVIRVWPTIQGEGPFAGEPAIFIRLAGCNLKCPGCDTQYTRDRQNASVQELVDTVRCQQHRDYNGRLIPRLVVISGGEPFRQPIGLLCSHLIEQGHKVQIETNGTAYQDMMPWYRTETEQLVIVCSPKTPKVNEHLQPYVHSLKYVLDHRDFNPVDGLPLTTLGNSCGVARPWPGFKGQIYLSPRDEQDAALNALNTKEVVRQAMKFGYRVSAQLHKYLGVD